MTSRAETMTALIQKVALNISVTGQDGFYLAEFLPKKGCIFHGIMRRSTQFNTRHVDHNYPDPHIDNARFYLHFGDLKDMSNLIRILQETQPDGRDLQRWSSEPRSRKFWKLWIHCRLRRPGHLAPARSRPHHRSEKKDRFYQSGTSKLYGLVQEIPQKAPTPCYPRSPYAVIKMYAYWIVLDYREFYGMYACNGILFNQDGPWRDETLVTRKITCALADIVQGLERCIYMGNMDALRDWRHSKDDVRMQWMMLQEDKPENFVIATGVHYSVRQLIEMAAKELGITLRFEGQGVDEQGIVASIYGEKASAALMGDVIVKVDPRYFLPTEVETFLGDPSKPKDMFGWVPEISLHEMCTEMVTEDLDKAQKLVLLRTHGYSASVSIQ